MTDPKAAPHDEPVVEYEDQQQDLGTDGLPPDAENLCSVDVDYEPPGGWQGAIQDAYVEGEDEFTPQELADIEVRDSAPPPPSPANTPIPEILDTDLNMLSGEAGVGKTWLVRAMVAQRKGVLLCATTGIASTNLGEGTTINAALGYFDTKSLSDNFVSGHLTARLGKLWRAGIRRIALDEISMMDGDQLTILVRALEELAGRKYTMNQALRDEIERAQAEEGENPDVELPLKLTCVGDFGQLPPVKAPFAFESPEWEKVAGLHGATTLKLTEIKRQSDRAFIEVLQAARRGHAEAVQDFFRGRIIASQDPHFAGTTILATNEAVDRFNQLRLDKVPGKLQSLVSSRWGKLRGDWKNIPEVLGLKVGAMVMVLSNRKEGLDRNVIAPKLLYANGDLGEVTAIDTQRREVWVRLKRTGADVSIEWVTRDNTIPLEEGREESLKAEGREDRIVCDAKGKPRFELVGGITYCPLRVAYASTVHKAQGLTLDNVQVDCREGFFKQPGLLYVALSRARSIDGLRLVGTTNLLAERCTVNAKIKPYL